MRGLSKLDVQGLHLKPSHVQAFQHNPRAACSFQVLSLRMDAEDPSAVLRRVSRLMKEQAKETRARTNAVRSRSESYAQVRQRSVAEGGPEEATDVMTRVRAMMVTAATSDMGTHSARASSAAIADAVTSRRGRDPGHAPPHRGKATPVPVKVDSEFDGGNIQCLDAGDCTSGLGVQLKVIGDPYPSQFLKPLFSWLVFLKLLFSRLVYGD